LRKKLKNLVLDKKNAARNNGVGGIFLRLRRLRLASSCALFSSTFIAKLTGSRLGNSFIIAAGRPIRTISAPMPRVMPFSFSVSHNTHLSREICKLCFRTNPVGFHVLDEIWKDTIPKKHQSDVVCLSCFARLADEKLIPWDRHIKLYPVSMFTHLEGVHEILEKNTGNR